MKFVVFAAALTLSAVASAQTARPAPAAPATTTVTTSTTTTTTAAAKYTLDTPIATIVADPAGKAVFDKDLPGLTAHPMFEQFKGMSVNQLAPMAGDKLTPDVVAKLGADLAAVK